MRRVLLPERYLSASPLASRVAQAGDRKGRLPLLPVADQSDFSPLGTCSIEIPLKRVPFLEVNSGLTQNFNQKVTPNVTRMRIG